MHMKSFEAATMQDAMEMARGEMGEDAVILATENKRNGNVFVTFALERAPDGIDDDAYVEEIDRPIGRYFNQEAAFELPANNNDQSPHQAIASVLRYHAVPELIAQQLLQSCDRLQLTESDDINQLESSLIDLFDFTYRFEPLPVNEEHTRVILVGPPGMGKTITAAKLAAKMVVDNQPVHLISTDTKRAAGSEQLQAFAKILGIELELATTRAELKAMLQEYDPKARVIVDSAGCNPYNFQELKELGEFAHISDIEPILVCAAGTDAHEATEIASVFSFLDIERVLITRTDCARHYGSLLSIAKAGDYAFSHMTSSAKAMGDMQPLDAKALAQLFIQYQRERIAA